MTNLLYPTWFDQTKTATAARGPKRLRADARRLELQQFAQGKLHEGAKLRAAAEDRIAKQTQTKPQPAPQPAEEPTAQGAPQEAEQLQLSDQAQTERAERRPVPLDVLNTPIECLTQCELEGLIAKLSEALTLNFREPKISRFSKEMLPDDQLTTWSE